MVQNKRSKKRVIIVGNSPSILLHEFGEQIDSYDIVIRVNRCVTKGFEKYIGKKINIWATTRTDTIDSYVPENYKDIKYLWSRTKKSNPNNKDSKTGKYYLKLPKDFPQEALDKRYIMFKNQKWYQNYDTFLKPFDLTKEPCTGLLTILTACRFYDDITVHGFTFGIQSEDKHRLSGYYRESELKSDNSDELVHDEDKHWFSGSNLTWGNRNEGNKKRKVLEKLVESGIAKKSKKDTTGFHVAHPPIKILNKEELGDMNL